ncbi:hypothetical protein CPB84DRAFT_1787723 [Gymnopilus junonius]|uniref:Uncharacterized protein n=1 Tax=Gymnopilus junonius TaxID=109634 RepID=A0A9P5TKK9_GYMJU|nr:hypothetical protein CPB84DRAFT_1787723 [Gymnopilus junonius]
METTDVDPTAPPTEERYTTHILGDIPHLPIQLSSSLQLLGTPDDPPPINFDDVYAGYTYPGHVMNVQDVEYDVRQQDREPDTLDMLMTLPYILVPKDKLQATLREAREKAEAAERREVQEKVNAWARQVTAA